MALFPAAASNNPVLIAEQRGARTTEPTRKPLRLGTFGIGALALAGLLALLVGLYAGAFKDRYWKKPGAAHIESIAVLPLKSLSNDSEQDYFADGMTEAVITDLGKVSALRVISRTSVMRYKDTKKPLPEIARELQVDALVEGTVARSGGRVRITANLVQASPERHLWAESYERDLRDVIALQNDVASAIVHEIQVKLSDDSGFVALDVGGTTEGSRPAGHAARFTWVARKSTTLKHGKNQDLKPLWTQRLERIGPRKAYGMRFVLRLWSQEPLV